MTTLRPLGPSVATTALESFCTAAQDRLPRLLVEYQLFCCHIIILVGG